MTDIMMHRTEADGVVSLRFVVTQDGVDQEVTHLVGNFGNGADIRKAVMAWARPYGGTEIKKA